MAPQLMQDMRYVLTAAAIHGAFAGVFAGRAARPWRLVLCAPMARALR